MSELPRERFNTYIAFHRFLDTNFPNGCKLIVKMRRFIESGGFTFHTYIIDDCGTYRYEVTSSLAPAVLREFGLPAAYVIDELAPYP